MTGYRKSLWMIILFTTMYVFACVTINIYFPAEQVESVAGDIVNEIRGTQGNEQEKSLKKDKNSLLRDTLLALSPSFAWAAEAVTVSNPTIRALKQKMKSRYAQLKPYYQKKMLKEGNDGYLSAGTTQGLGLKEKRDMKNLVSAENADRKKLYTEIAKALKIDSSQIKKVAEIFAKEWKKSVK